MAEKTLKSLKFYGLDDVYKIPSGVTRDELREELSGIVHPVSSVNGQTGVVELTADSVGAATPAYVNAAKEEAKTYIEEQVKIAAPRNLLYNSDFRNPVNQGMSDSYTGERHTIDRWYL